MQIPDWIFWWLIASACFSIVLPIEVGPVGKILGGGLTLGLLLAFMENV